MTDITSQEIQSLIEALHDTASAFKGPKSGSTTPNNPNSPHNDFKKYVDSTKKHSSIFKKWGTDLDSLAKKHNKFGKDLTKLSDDAGIFSKSLMVASTATVGLIELLRKHLPASIDSFRAMNDIGQTFGGSMLQMNIAAAEARMNLSDFTKLMKANNLAVGSIGVKAFTNLSNSLKDNLSQFGMLGLSTDELNEYLTGYLETQRSYGLLERMSQTQAADALKNLAIETTKMSEVTGKSRSDILKTTNAAMQQDSLRARMSIMTQAELEKFGPAAQSALTYLGAMPKESGDILSRMMSQTLGRGDAGLTDDGKDMGKAGLSEVIGLFNELAQKINSGVASQTDFDEFRKSVVKAGMANMEGMKVQESIGNEAAKRAIRMVTELANYNDKVVKGIQGQEAMTKMLLNLQTKWKEITAFIREKFYKSLESALGPLETFLKSDAMASFKDKLGVMAEQMGVFIGKTLTPENMAKIGDGLVLAAKGLGWVVSGLGVLLDIGLKVGKGFEWLAEKTSPLGAALITLTALLAAKTLISGIKNRLNGSALTGDPFRKYAVGNAIRVVSMGANGGGGGGSGQFPDYDNDKNKRDEYRRNRRTQTNRKGPVRSWRRAPFKNSMYALGNGIGSVGGATRRGYSGTKQFLKGLPGAMSRTGGSVIKGIKGSPGMALGGILKGLSKANGMFKGVMPFIKRMPLIGALLSGGMAVGSMMGMNDDPSKSNEENRTERFRSTGASVGGALGGLGGAFLGSFAGPIGTIVGGYLGAWGGEIIGGYVGKWVESLIDEDIGGQITKAWSATTEVMGSAWKSFVTDATSAWTSFSTTASTFASEISNFASTSATKLQTAVSDTFTGAQSFVTGMTTSLATNISSFATNAIDYVKNNGATALNAIVGVSPIGVAANALSTVTNMVNGPVPTVDIDVLRNQVSDLQAQLTNVIKENSEQKAVFNRMIDLLQENNGIQKAGLIEMIEETRKGTKSLRNIGSISGLV